MRLIKEIFLRDWKYKLTALVIAVSLWSVVNFGSRTAITVTRYVEQVNANPNFVYSIEPDRVNLTVYVIERLLLSRLIERVGAYVDLSTINEPGTYRLEVKTKTDVPFLIHPTSVDPPSVTVVVRKKPPE